MQYELVTGPLTPLEAADALVHTRETVYNIAAKHGLRATLAPTMHIDGCTFHRVQLCQARILIVMSVQAAAVHRPTSLCTPLRADPRLPKPIHLSLRR